MSIPQPEAGYPAWLLTWTTYGTWLPGDPRGSVSRRPEGRGRYVIHNVPGTAYDDGDRQREQAARERMHGDPVRLDAEQARVVLDAVLEASRTHGIAPLAVAVMSDHVHVLCQSGHEGAELMRLFKGVAARRLNQGFERRGSPRWWTKSGSRRYIRARDDVGPALRYVLNQRGALARWCAEVPEQEDPSSRCRSARTEVRGSSRAARTSPRSRSAGTEVCGSSRAAHTSSRSRSARTEVCGPSQACANAADHGAEPHVCAVCCFIKHTNPCGVGVVRASSDDHPLARQLEAYRRAYLGDPSAAMGGILAVNFPVTADFATAVLETYARWGRPLRDAGAKHAPGGFFVEVWVAPDFDDEAVRIIRGQQPGGPQKSWGRRVRLVRAGDPLATPDGDPLEFRSVLGGMLAQTADGLGLNESDWRVVSKRPPSEAEWRDLKLAWLICKHTKSNAITICRDGMLIGSGAGQTSRVMSCRIATWQARENGHGDALAGAVAASDAFFPFRDGPEVLIEAGVRAIIQPGGSKRDAETIAACDERDVALVLTGTRHFRH